MQDSLLLASPQVAKRSSVAIWKEQQNRDEVKDPLSFSSIAPIIQKADTLSVTLPQVVEDATVMASSWLEHGFSKFLWMMLLAAPLAVSYYTHSIIGVSATISIIAGLCTHSITPEIGRLLLQADMCGRDLNKPRQPKLAESLGIASGSVFLIAMFLFIPFPFLDWMAIRTQSSLETLGNYTAALLSISAMLFLGFADDVLNLKWRHKILLPAMSALPLLMIYRLTSDRTQVVVPIPLRGLFLGQTIVDIGFLYYVYMAAVAVFCTHSINILAGVNGVEVGQSLVIGCFVLINNIISILGEQDRSALSYFSVFLVLPFVSVSAALLMHNWWPAKVFVGDTFCYFAGMTLAVAGILGHFSKTLLLLFLPQIFNFVLSCPQLFGLIPCPRHRLPRLNPATGKLEASTVVIIDHKKLSRAGKLSLLLLAKLKLIKITKTPSDLNPSMICTNFTLLSMLLVWFGPMREDRLCMLVMALQAFSCTVVLIFRHFFSKFLF